MECFVFKRLLICGGLIILIVTYLYTINKYSLKREGTNTNWLPWSWLNNESGEVNMLDVYDLSAHFNGSFLCPVSKTNPQIYLCLHSLTKDTVLSMSIVKTGIWQWYQTNLITKILNMDKNSVLVDIGANIGYFSLLAAKSGHSVIAIEPYLENIKRMHMAVQLNKMEKRILSLNNAVAERRSEGFLKLSHVNQGDTRVEMEAKLCSGDSCLNKIRTILLNDIASFFPDKRQVLPGWRRNINSISKKYEKYLPLFVNVSNVVMKIDVQGYEHRIFLEADKFFEQVPVSYIFMEWDMVTQHANYSDTNKAKKAKESKMFPRRFFPKNSPPDAKLLRKDINYKSLKSTLDILIIEKMISFLLEKGFLPYGSIPECNGVPLDTEIWGYWPYDILWARYPHVDANYKFP